jgi:hypothetical protein
MAGRLTCMTCVSMPTCKPGACTIPWGCSQHVDDQGRMADDFHLFGPKIERQPPAQDEYCAPCMHLATCNVVLKEPGGVLEGCGDRILVEAPEKVCPECGYSEECADCEEAPEEVCPECGYSEECADCEDAPESLGPLFDGQKGGT